MSIQFKNLKNKSLPNKNYFAKKSLAKFFKFGPCIPFFASAMMGLSIPSFAQDGEEEKALEEVVVTGTRIRQDPLSQGSPVVTLTAKDLDRSGLTSLGDFLQRLTASGGGLNSRFNSSGNFGFPPDGGGIGAGASQIDLRYLGSNRTLVLVDGVRWVNGSSASGVSSAVDLNTIPTAIIERIEVLEDGASSIYGSDAIAGVVNIITKKDFEGFEIEAYSGAYDEGDGENNEINLSIGSHGEKSRIFLNIGYVNSNDVLAADRDQASTPIPFVTNGLGGSSGTPQGRFVFTDPNTGIDVDCTINNGVTGVPRYDASNPCGPNDDFHPFTNADRFNFSPFNLVLAPNERTNIYTQAQYDLTPTTTFTLKGLFNNRKSTNQAAPEPLFIGPEAGNGNLLDTISVDASNPFNPFGFTIDANTNPFFFGRRPLEGGPRVFEQDVNTFYVSAGLQGQFELADRNFYWDVNFSRSQNRADQIKTGGYNSARIRQALGPIEDCTDPCVPLNFFGGQGDGTGTITQEQLDYISFVQKDVSEQELSDISANISGTLFNLPAGAFAFAAGVEYREQDGFFQPDAVVVAGESAGVPSTPTRGGFDVEEYYLELQVPILANLPGADLLDLSLALRTSDYSTFGSESTGKVGFKYRPVKNLLIRGSVSEGLRAPGIGELFGSAARFDQTLADPCSDLLGTQPGSTPADSQTIANCQALGVPVDGSYVQFNNQISVTTGGNRQLQQEESDSFTLGFVYDADWVDNQDWIEQFTVEGTYYDHEIEGAIQALDAQVQLEGCINTLDPTLCSGITRTAGGVINGFSNQLTNIGGIETSGYDLTFTYLSPTYNFGQVKLTWQNTFLDEYVEQVPTSTGFIDVHLEGTETGDPEQAYPELKSTLTAELFYDNWAFAATFRYIDEVTEDCTGLAGLGLCSNEAAELNTLDETLYVDLAASWSVPSDTEITISAGLLNVTDEDSPTCFSCALNGFDATTYDVPGVFGYVRFNVKL
ncbi:TonB-dependent receptor [Sessilibacter sp. MAH1]